MLTPEDAREADFPATDPVLTRAQVRPEAVWVRLTLQAPDLTLQLAADGLGPRDLRRAHGDVRGQR